jgi:hypothetical protein
MDLPTHIIDPEGKVIIILRNADRHFAGPVENAPNSTASDIFTEMLDSVQSPVEVIENSEFHFEQPELTPKEKRKKKKKNQRKGSGSITTTLEFTSPPNEEPSAEEPVAEEPAAEEPAGESCFTKKYLPAVGKKVFITGKKAQLKSLQKAGILRHS